MEHWWGSLPPAFVWNTFQSPACSAVLPTCALEGLAGVCDIGAETSSLGPLICLLSPEVFEMMVIQGCHKLIFKS